MNNNWFESRGLRVLNYQQDAIGKVQESMSQREISVLAAAPSAGKTLMTIYIIEEYLKRNPTHKVLVLAHGTTILRTQFHDVLDEIKPDFSYNLVEKFNQYDVTADVNVCLPQTLAGNELNKINLLVVDEAHQFYFAEKMMKEIIKKTKPQKQLLLTGTPSPFIRKGFKIIPVTLNTIFDEGMITDLFVEIATSSYSFDPMYDFNPNTDELKSSVHFKESETKKTLDDLISKIVDRLKSIKDNQYQNLLPEWLPTLKKLQKTMIACRSQHQAMQVKSYFDKIGVKSALSISDIDYDSSEIERFKNETDCLILIVVGRGILGFNYPELVNVVDMTTSQNVDRIYQLLCRVIRKHPEEQKKLFFKIAPNIHSDYYKYIMTAVLSLSDESFFTKFNGKNFSDMIIPIIKTKREHHEPSNNNGGSKSRPITLKPIDFEGLPVFEFFKDLYHKKDALLHVYAYTTVRDVRAEFMKFKPNGYWNDKEKCLESALQYFSTIEWFKNESSAYNAARKNGWWEECTKHMTNKHKSCNFWTKEMCVEDALKYSKKIDWRNNNGSAYVIAKSNGWMEECTKHMIEGRKPNGYWTKEKCLESALKYSTIKEWSEKDSSAYTMAKEYHYMDDCTKHMTKLQIQVPRNYWTKEKCLESALKYSTIKEWVKNDNAALQAARSNGWYSDCIKHMTKLKQDSNAWTKEAIIEDANKYKTPTEWRKNNQYAYNLSQKNGWYNESIKHMITIKEPKWTYEKCLESALKYSLLYEWRMNERAAYNAATRNGWTKKCTEHMKNKWYKI